MTTFVCERCGREFERVRSDDDAWAEAIERFGVVDDPVLVCDDCDDEMLSMLASLVGGLMQSYQL